jgi:addiction module RelE/StbE family toxin
MEGKNYSIKFTTKAEEDLDEIYEYIANNLFASEAADNLMDKFENKILTLKSFPYSSSFVADEVLKNRGYRKLIIDNYIVFYLINEQEQQVIIMRILYGASNYKNIL